MIINQCPEKRGERDTSKIPVGQGNHKARGGGEERGGVEREGESDGTWYITVILSGINLSHKRIGNNKGKKRGFRKGKGGRGSVLNGTLQGVLRLLGNITLVTNTL